MLSKPEKYSFNPTTVSKSAGPSPAPRPAQELTIKHGLAQRHDGSRPPKKHRQSPFPPRHSTPLIPASPPQPQVSPVQAALDQIHRPLRACEPVALLPRPPPVHVVYGPVELVRDPQRLVQEAALHRVRPQQDVARVPRHEHERHGEPQERETCGRVGPGGAGRGPGRGARRDHACSCFLNSLFDSGVGPAKSVVLCDGESRVRGVALRRGMKYPGTSTVCDRQHCVSACDAGSAWDLHEEGQRVAWAKSSAGAGRGAHPAIGPRATAESRRSEHPPHTPPYMYRHAVEQLEKGPAEVLPDERPPVDPCEEAACRELVGEDWSPLRPAGCGMCSSKTWEVAGHVSLCRPSHFRPLSRGMNL